MVNFFRMVLSAVGRMGKGEKSVFEIVMKSEHSWR